MKKILRFSFVILFSLLLVACSNNGENKPAQENSGSDGEVKTYRLATDAALDYPTTKALTKFSELVKEKSNGKIVIDVYESSILGDEVSYLEQLQVGTIDFAKLSLGTIGGLYNDLQVFNLPFLFKNSDEMWKVLESEIGNKVLNGLNSYSIQGLGFTDNGSRCFYTTHEVKSIADFSKKNIRVQQNELMMNMVKNLGGNPINVAANEVYSALQTGVADGGENNINIILSDSLYEVAPYVILDNHTTGFDIICVNLDLWNKFSDDEKKILQESMNEAKDYQKEIWNEATETSLKTLEEKGAKIHQPDDQTLQDFREAMQPIYDQYQTKYSEWITEINNVLGNK